MKSTVRIIALVLAFVLPAAHAYDELVEKKVFAMKSDYKTLGGKTIKNVRIGYETYGKLNEARDNVILIGHYFSGNSHAAGKYSADEKVAGYWDSIIGSGKAIDTDKYFVISSDTLANMNTKDPKTITTGPATINPDTGKPYGMSFPIVTVRDFVNVQKALMDELGIKKIHTVMGASMGSMQALEWASAYPNMVERVIAVIPGGVEANPFLVAQLNRWAANITQDSKWNNGDYYGKEEPVTGVAEALKSVTVDSRTPAWAAKAFGRKWAAADKDPLASFGAKYAIEDTLDKATLGRAKALDANSVLYIIRANQLYQVGHSGSAADGVKNIKAKVMFIPAKSDLLLYPEYAKHAADMLRAQGNQVEYFEIDGDGGHLDGVFAIGKASDAIKGFLSSSAN